MSAYVADVHDTKAGIMPAKQACKGYLTIEYFCAHAGYRETFAFDASQTLEREVDILSTLLGVIIGVLMALFAAYILMFLFLRQIGNEYAAKFQLSGI